MLDSCLVNFNKNGKFILFSKLHSSALVFSLHLRMIPYLPVGGENFIHNMHSYIQDPFVGSVESRNQLVLFNN